MAHAAGILTALQNIQSLPEETHWFCPRKSSDDDGLYYPEDIQGNPLYASKLSAQERASEVSKASSRKVQMFEALQIFAFDGKDAAQYQDWLEKHLGEQMRRCDVCVREFHMGRKRFKEQLNDIYDEDEVRTFMEKFDKLNLKRIEAGLATAVMELSETPTELRKASALSPAALYAIFESFTCRAMYADEGRLSQHFDKPFDLVQTNKFLKLSAYTPAMTQFLFGQNSYRIWWAERSWEKFKRNIMPSEFEWSVREPLLNAIARVQILALEKDFLTQFWSGVQSIVQRLDRELITHSLRAIDGGTMEADVCRLALSHLQIDTDGFKSLLATVNHILKVSPADFWEAMGTISPSSWIDQFFNSPALARLLIDAGKDKSSDSPALDALFSWVIPFLTSIKPVNQAAACRSLLNRLLETFQNSDRPQVVKTHCFRLGLHVLAETFRSLNSDRMLSNIGVASAEAFEVAEQHISCIALSAKKTSTMVAPSAEVFRQIVTLDCKCILSSFESISPENSTQQVTITYHASIWKQATTSIGSGNVILAKRLLSATKSFIGIEPFVARSPQTLSVERAQFNTTFEAVNRSLCDILERVNDFDPSEIATLFDDADSTNAIMVLMFSSDARVREAAMEMVKTLSGQSTSSETVHYLLQEYLYDIMNALSTSLRQISCRKSFASASSMLRLCADIVDALCDSQTGFLRSENLDQRDAEAIERFWQSLWRSLTMIFSNTETWSNIGHDKGLLMEFCRHAMEFAEKAFDQFGVFSGALDQATHDESGATGSAGKRLIEQPTIATNAIVRWLKLRDEVLVARSCALVCKLLVRLREFDTELSEETLQFVMQVAFSNSRSTLSNQQKAELIRALEKHAGHSVEILDETPPADARSGRNKRTDVIDLEKWQANAQASGSDRDEVASAISAASSTFERFRAQQSLKPSEKLAVKQSIKSAFKPVDATEFKKKRQQEMEEMKRKNALAIAAQKKRITGEGSGLKGLGLHGKDHTAEPKGTGMMVSSEEESDDDDLTTDLDRELFGISSKSAKKINGTNLTDEQARALKQQRQVPVKKQRLVRSARDMRARLAPDLSPLHKVMLAWEYFHEGAFPPNSSAQDYTGVVNTFRDPLDYQRVFQPLLILEAWNGFLKAREENTSRPYEIKIVNRSSVDAFLEVGSTMSPADGKELSEGDIILLSKAKIPGTTSHEPHCLTRIYKITRRKGLLEILYRAVPGTSLAPSLGPGTILYGLKITSLIPLEREYGALLGLQYYDLCDEITRAKPSPLLTYGDSTLQTFMNTYTVNKAQAKAVKCAIDNDGFTLVQGPPGSGKTKTIVAIVGALLSDVLGGGGVRIGQPQGVRSDGLAKKMLVCAPSNAAVDELVMRFKDGVKTLSGKHRHVNIVRLGRSDAVNANVQDVTLEELVNKKLSLNPANGDGRAETQKVMEEHKGISEKLRNTRARMDEAEDTGGPSKELKEEFDTLRRQKAILGQKVDKAKDNETAQIRQADIHRKRAQQQVIDEAHVICATLSGSGHDMFQTLNIEFETVIIDEAAQCVELSALIPLKYGCAKCILVGDPQQLPPTVFSKDAARFKYEQSLFVRMQVNHPKDVHLLDTQYRMHPEISLFPSKTFYDGRLLDGKDMGPLRTRPWHGTALLSPFRFFDVEGQHQAAPKGHSLINQAEINIAMQLYLRLTSDFGDYEFKGKIGIITPYKSQLRELKEQFRHKLGQDVSDGIEFNTTDAFQGREAEIIIFSCVRASPAGGIGFLQDIRRMNVGLTRAKCSLWVLGNSQSLKKGEFWGKLIDDAQSRNCYTRGDLRNMLGQPLRIVRHVDDGSERAVPKSETLETKVVKSEPRSYDNRYDIDVKKRMEVKQENGTMAKATNSNLVSKVDQYVHIKNDPDKKLKRPGSKPGEAIEASRPAKRKLSIDSGDEIKPAKKSNSSASSATSAISSDVEMTDAPASRRSSGSEAVSETNGGIERPSPSNITGPAATGSLKAGASNGPGTAGNVYPKKPAVAPMRKKKPVDPFIRKKPRP